MNYFFFLTDNNLNCELQIPRFKNNGDLFQEISLFEVKLINNYWLIDNAICDYDNNFYYLKSNIENKNNIYFLALNSDIKSRKVKHLYEYNSYTKTIPDFRSNLCITNDGGGFSSYQSEYPYKMTLYKGSLISSVSTLLNNQLASNSIFIKNIFHKPIIEKYPAYLVSKKEKQVLREFEIYSNSTNKIELLPEDISVDNYIVAKGYLGIPVYISMSDSHHMSLEHTHPPHSNIKGKNQFSLVTDLRNKLLEIVN